MDFEQLFKEMESKRGEMMNKKLYTFKDYPNDKYYCLKLSDECRNLLDWLINDIGLLDATLIPTDEVEAREF